MPSPSEASGTGSPQKKLLNDRVDAVYQDEEIVIWNHLTVEEHHYVTGGRIESEHKISCGDAPGGESPDYITPEMADQLMAIDVYPNAEVVDPFSDEVTLL